MSYVPTLRAVRAHFGLTQQELASWLGLSRSAYSVVEAGREALPAHARAWLRPWATALSYLPDPPPPEPLDSALLTTLPAGPEALRARLLACYLEAERLRERLEQVQLRTLRNRRRQGMAGPLLAALTTEASYALREEDAATRWRRRWLNRWLEAAADELLPTAAATGPTAEALLTARRAACQHEAATLRAYLDSLPAPANRRRPPAP